MDTDEKALDDLDDIEEFSGLEERHNILSLMRNMMESEHKKFSSIEIFDDTNHDIFPTIWGKESQIATCRKCNKTGDTVIKRKCGVGNSCCSCCFILLCIWCYIPCLCCKVCDVHHFCQFCKSPVGVKTFI